MIEILSPLTTKNDRTLKKDFYEKVGVDEYWIVDPENRNVEQHVLEYGRYNLLVYDGEIKRSILPEVIVSTAGIWKF